MEKLTSDYTIVIFGKTGHGKSSILNKICQIENKFKEGHSLESTTEEIHSELVEIDKKKYLLIDTPGFYDTKNRDVINTSNIATFLHSVKNGFNLIIFAWSLLETKFDVSLQLSLSLLGKLFGNYVFEHILIIFTHQDEINENFRKNQIEKYNLELPELFNFYDFTKISNNFLLFDYNKNDGNLAEVKNMLKNSKKFKPEILIEIDKLNEEIFKDPLLVLEKLTENSKEMRDFLFLKEDYVNLQKDFEIQNLKIEEEKKNYRNEIEKLSNKKEELQNEKKSIEIEEIIIENNKKIEQINKTYQEHMKKHNDEYVKKEEERRKKTEEMLTKLINDQNSALNKAENKFKQAEEKLLNYQKENNHFFYFKNLLSSAKTVLSRKVLENVFKNQDKCNIF